jgi:hypothetical protein
MKNFFIRSVFYVLGVLLFISLSSFTIKRILSVNETVNDSEGFVVMELFTSQGCSSCPPADKVLAKYAMLDNPNIIPLAFHVDYWNYIGWKDPFSKVQFSERQRHYGKLLNAQGVYTPQLIINGKYQLIGSKESEISVLVEKELEKVSKNVFSFGKLNVTGDKLNIELIAKSYLPNTVYNIAVVKKNDFTAIKRGENSGLNLMNYNVVYDFKSIPNNKDLKFKTDLNFKSNWITSDFFIVAYLQDTNTGRVLSAGKSNINFN